MPEKRDRKSYLLRIDEGLWDDLNRWANSEFRSVNGQIELVLKRAVEDWKKHRRDSTDEDFRLKDSK